ncbi:phage tail spike protein [Lacticaseibacillus pantheris]|uniref:phage tail spike protein n=1 Tax=Lacticaseibacillus pantheris TaxID=171523 RepID=UPI00265A8966|nr:phage tail spike protein [Lacticaseibacillus pantheris]WKF84495.1 phage tail spike protein [Lacticaseibacillus pantheris]
MTPVLYAATERQFIDNGLGPLGELYSTEVIEKRNGELELTAYYPATGRHYDDIKQDRIILAKPNPRDDPHAFRIVSAELDIAGQSLEIIADSITNDLAGSLITDLSITDATGDDAMRQIHDAMTVDVGIEMDSDIQTKSSTSFKYVNPLEAVAGTTGSILQYWGGEMKRENGRLSMLKRRGYDNVTTFRLGKNIKGLTYTVDASSLVTRVYPYWHGQLSTDASTTQEETYISGTVVDSSEIGKYSHVYIKPVDASQEITVPQDATAADIKKLVDEWAKNWFTQSANTDVDKPKVTLDITPLDLQSSTDYADKLAVLETLGLTDSVTVYVPEYGVDVTAVVNELHYDPLLEQTTEIVAGTAKVSFAESNANTLSTMQSQLAAVATQADAAVISADGKSTNYYGDQPPVGATDGDYWFYSDVNGEGIKQLQNGTWVIIVDTNLPKQLETQMVAASAATSAAVVTANSAADKASLAAQSVAAVSADVTIAQSVAEQARSTATDAAASGSTAMSNAATALSLASGATVKATSVGASVDSLAGTIQLKADQSVVDGLSKSVSSASAELTVQAGQIAVKADSTTVNSLAGTVSSQGTQLAAQAGSLALTVSKSDLTNSLAGYATQAYTQAQVTAASDKIQSSVSAVSAKIDAQQFGTRNYLLASASYPSPDMPTKPTDSFNVNKDMQLSVDPTYFNGKQIIVSVMVDIDTVTAVGTGRTRAGWEMSIRQADGTTGYAGGWVNITSTDVGTSIHKRVYAVFSPTQYQSLTTARSYAQNFTAKSITVSKPMVALGNVLTDWSPAPEDGTSYTDTQVSTVTQTVTALQATVADKASTSQLTQLSDSLTATIESTTAPNLISDSGWYYDSDPVGSLSTFSLAWYTGSHTLWTLSNPSKTVSVYAKSNQFAVVPGATYTFSMLTELGTSTTKTPTLYFLGSKKAPDNPTGTYDNEGILPLGDIPVTSTDVLYYTKTFTVPAGITSGFMRISNDGDTAGSYGGISFAEAQLERGTIATPYRDSVPGMLTEMSAMQGNINLKVSKGDTLSQINIEAGKTLIQSKSIYLDASTVTVGGTAFINAANIKSVNADTITAGTLDAANANVINLNASNITTGTIKGANLSINLSTGEVLFSKGQIKSTDGTLDINADQRYISTANGDTRAVMRNGGILLTQPELFDSSQTPYLEISNTLSGASWSGATFKARDYAVLTNSANTGDIMSGIGGLGTQSFSGIATGKANDRWIPTVVGGADRGVLISGGKETNYSNINGSPYILVGANGAYDYGTGYGSRIVISADYVHLPSAYTRTTATSANVVVSQDGAITRATSASKYKRDIIRSNAVTDGLKLIGIPTATWYDIGDIDRLKDTDQEPPRGIGVIAEDLAAAGLDDLVVRGSDGELEGVQYDRMTAVLLPLLKDIYNRLTYMEAKANGN